VSNWGSLGATVTEVRRLPRVVRERADVILARALGLRLAPAAQALPVGGCRTVGGGGRPAVGAVPRGGAVLEPGTAGPVDVSLRRFGERFSAPVGGTPPGQRALLLIPTDPAPDLWQLAASAGPLRVCALAGERARIERYCEITRRLEASARQRDVRAGEPSGGDGRRGHVRQRRRLFAELLQVAPPEVREALEVSVGSIGGKKPPAGVVEEARRSLEAFERRACR
jgi:hypothetical protein